MNYIGPLSTFFITIVSILIAEPIAQKIGLVDEANHRKCHQGRIALVGGIAILLGISFGLLLTHIPLKAFRALFAANLLLLLAGVADDMHEISPSLRLGIQLFAATLVTLWSGVYLDKLGDFLGFGPLSLGYWGIPITVIAMVGMINATNMSDGIDGLAGSLISIEFFLFLLVSLHLRLWAYALVILIFLAAIAAFLIFNFPRRHKTCRQIFLGDAGSTFLGFTIAWFAIHLSQYEQNRILPVTYLWILALPIFDTLTVMFRRIRKGLSPFTADREHLHHIFLLAGLSAQQTTLVMSAFAGLLGFIGILADVLNLPEWIMFYAFLVCFLLYLVAINKAWKVMKYIRARIAPSP